LIRFTVGCEILESAIISQVLILRQNKIAELKLRQDNTWAGLEQEIIFMSIYKAMVNG
jgi:hypothetical protein